MKNAGLPVVAALARPCALAAGALLVQACGAPPDTARPVQPRAPAQTGEASYYHPSLAGKPTSTGEPLEAGAMAAASRTLPLGAKARVTNLENGKSVSVTIADRGPYAQNRILDVTPKAADRLDMKDDGVATVRVTPLDGAKASAAR
jgi:rare lipoprotein A